jgi:hypothetical protein
MNDEQWTMNDEQRTVHCPWFIVHRCNVGIREVNKYGKNIVFDLFNGDAIPSVPHSNGLLCNRSNGVERNPGPI